MSSTVYWQQVTPDRPLGSYSGLKWLIWDRDNAPRRGEKEVVRASDRLATYLKGYLDGLPHDHESREPIAQFLEDLRVHGQLEVWVGQ